MKKALCTLATILCILLLFFTSALAHQEPTLQIPTITKEVFVYDQAQVIASNMEEVLNEKLASLSWSKEIEFFIVTIRDSYNISLGEYSYRLFNELGIGENSVNGGILLVASELQSDVVLVASKNIKKVLFADVKEALINDSYMVIHNESNITMAVEQTTKDIFDILQKNAATINTFITRQTALSLWTYLPIATCIILLVTLSIMLCIGFVQNDFGLLFKTIYTIINVIEVLVLSILLVVSFGRLNFLPNIRFKGFISPDFSGGSSRGGGGGRSF